MPELSLPFHSYIMTLNVFTLHVLGTLETYLNSFKVLESTIHSTKLNGVLMSNLLFVAQMLFTGRKQC